MSETPEVLYVIFNRIFHDLPGQKGTRWVAFATHEEPSQAMYGGPGDTALYQAKGRREKDGLPPRFELVERLTVEPPPKPKEAKVKTVEIFEEASSQST